MDFLFTLQVDCESTQRTIANPGLGERAVRGLGEVLAQTGMKATFVVIPPDIQAHAAVYRELAAQGHEIGLHTHPAEQGYQEFLGVYSYEDQLRIIGEGADLFAQHFGYRPLAFTPGYCSANDHTYPALEALGFRHGSVSLPTRNLPQCACVWGSSPQDAHYAHRHNRVLAGDVDFVDVPFTVDVDSRLWGGAHPQDLRIELVDAKNHWYTLHKSVQRQLALGEKLPVRYLKAFTHNVFDYGDPRDFRRETLVGVIAAARQICEQAGARLLPATTADIAAAFRARVPKLTAEPPLSLDARGRAGWTASPKPQESHHAD